MASERKDERIHSFFRKDGRILFPFIVDFPPHRKQGGARERDTEAAPRHRCFFEPPFPTDGRLPHRFSALSKTTKPELIHCIKHRIARSNLPSSLSYPISYSCIIPTSKGWQGGHPLLPFSSLDPRSVCVVVVALSHRPALQYYVWEAIIMIMNLLQCC